MKLKTYYWTMEQHDTDVQMHFSPLQAWKYGKVRAKNAYSAIAKARKAAGMIRT